MQTMNDCRKDCFGMLQEVFPMGGSGLREVPARCFDCPHKTPCMKAALETREGIAFKDDVLGRSPVKGFLGRLKRWSEKKELARQMKEKEKTPTCD